MTSAGRDGGRPASAAAALRREAVGVALCLGLAALLGLLGARALSIGGHTLEASGRWTATKVEVERSLLGARSFFTGAQALADGDLDLGAWHGFHEVMLEEPVEPLSIELRFRLTEGAYLAVLFNDLPGGGRSGLRLGWHRRFRNLFFDATADGEFLRTRPTGLPPLRTEAWQTLRLDFGDDRVEATLDGRPPLRFRTELGSPQRIGLRSGARSVRVDDLTIRTRDGRTLRESFDRPTGARAVAAATAIGAVALTAALLVAAARRGRLRPKLFALATVELVLVVAAVLWQPVAARRAAAYPAKSERLLAQEEQLRQAELDRVAAQIEERHAPRPALGTRRLLFLGASQTWGAGATRNEDVWVQRLETLLNDSAPEGVAFECVNAGVSSLRSHHVRQAFAERWAALEPWAVIVNLANNDRRPEALARNLEAIVERSRRAGARVVLVLEPNATEMWRDELGNKHDAVRRVGESLEVPVLDLHGYLARRYDDGFLWWDVVHLTSYGQRLAAEWLHDELVRLGFAAPAPAEPVPVS